MENRQKLLDAAARVYGELGFRGATTRRIADVAGVNEITIFRHFGSKATLIREAVRCAGLRPTLPPLPAEPGDPARELTKWCAEHLRHLRDSRSLIRKAMGEIEERPEQGPCVSEGALQAAQELRRYMIQMRKRGYVSWERSDGDGQRVNPYAAGAMLMAALFADAMGRDMMPEMYPQPAERAPAMYVRLFLRAIGAHTPERRPVRQPRATARRPEPNAGRRAAVPRTVTNGGRNRPRSTPSKNGR